MKKVLLTLFVLLPTLVFAALKPVKHKNDKWGYKESFYTKKFVIKPKFENALPFVGDYAFVCRNKLWGVIGKDGKFVLPPKYSWVQRLDNKPYIVGLDGKFGLFDVAACRELCPVKYNYINECAYGTFLAASEGAYGLLNQRGELFVPTKYSSITKYDNGTFRVVDEANKCGLLDKSGSVIIEVKYDNFEKGAYETFVVKSNGAYGLLNKQGQPITEVKYDRIEKETYETFVVSASGKYGLLNKQGQPLTALKYDKISSFKNETFIVKVNDKLGLLDKYGKALTSLIYDSIATYGNSSLLVKSDGKCGLLSNLGQVIIPVKYSKISILSDFPNIYKVEDEGCVGFINKNGKVIAEAQYEHWENLGDNIFALYDGKWHFIDIEGSSVDMPNNAILYQTIDGDMLSPTGNLMSVLKNVCYNGNGLLISGWEICVIEDNAFTNCRTLRRIMLPKSIKEIGKEAFKGCSSLVSIAIPEGVTVIESETFDYCSSLSNITIPNSVTEINCDFVGCNSLPVVDGILYAGTYLLTVVDKSRSSYTIKPETRFIRNGAFQNCKNITSLVIPDNVVSIGYCAFEGCVKLRSLTLGKSLTYMNAFGEGESSEKIQTVYISDLKWWCEFDRVEYDFEGEGPMFPNAKIYLNNQLLTNLTSVTIPSGVTKIGSYTFCNCSKLTSVVVPSGVTEIGTGAFKNCTSLTNVSLPNSVTTIYSAAFEDCRKLSTITMPDSVENIETDAFVGCSSLPIVDNIRYAGPFLVGVADKSKTSYTIRKGTRVIGVAAFRNCTNLKSITIPESVKAIGLVAFENCKSLRSFYCKPTTPPASAGTTFEGGFAADIWQSSWLQFGDYEEYAFREIKTTIYVPKASEQLYKDDFGWSFRAHNIVGYNF